jgi:hypothetical protein
MSTLILPAPIAAYFEADRLNPEAVARCFTAHAVVQDEGRTHAGPVAIRAWKAEASRKYTYTVKPLDLAQEEGVDVVRARVTGNFPGSPIDLRYRFRLERGSIVALEIGV